MPGATFPTRRCATDTPSGRDLVGGRVVDGGGSVMEWQPIETAPKDGTVVDLWCRRDWNPPETHVRCVDLHWDRYAHEWRFPDLHYYNVLSNHKLTAEFWMNRPEPPKP